MTAYEIITIVLGAIDILLSLGTLLATLLSLFSKRKSQHK